MTFRSKSTYYFAILSLSVILFAASCAAFLIVHSANIRDFLKERHVFIAELPDDSAQPDIYVLVNALKSYPEIQSSSVRFVSKDEGLAYMRREMRDSLLFDENPLQDIVQFQVEVEHFDPISIAGLVRRIEAQPNVLRVHYDGAHIESVNRILQRLQWLLAAVALLALLFSLLMIYNAFHLLLYADRKKIKTMQIVGARWSFIRRPYIRQAIRMALWASAWAIALFAICLWLLRRAFPDWFGIVDTAPLVYIAIAVVLFGLFFCWLCSYIIVTRHIRQSYLSE